MSEPAGQNNKIEWLTLAMMVACYSVWAVGTTWVWTLWWPGALVLTALSITLFSSLQHEVLHRHPLPSRWLSEALVFPGLTVYVPFLRFRDQHLEHHTDSRLTGPYDDPESNYLDPVVLDSLPWALQRILRFNNTLMGRLAIGPLVSLIASIRTDQRAIRKGERSVLMGWLWRVPALGLLGLWLVYVASMPVWAYMMAAYMGYSILIFRTFLEHRAHDRARGRTVVVEGKGLLSFLFLNNSLHVVHHMHPRAPWYALPKLLADNKEHYLKRSDSFYYKSYGQIFRAYFFRAKDPVPHPLWRRP